MTPQTGTPESPPVWVRAAGWVTRSWTALRDPQTASLSLLERYHLRVSTGLMLIFVALTLMYTFTSVNWDDTLVSNQSGLRLILLSGVVVLTLILLYFLVRGGLHRIVGWATLLIASGLLFAYAYTSVPPHFEIVGFVIIPIIASHILSRNGTIAISVAMGIVVAGFVLQNPYLDDSRLALNYVWFYVTLAILQLYLIGERRWLDDSREIAKAQQDDETALFVQYLPALVWKVDSCLQVTLRNQQALASNSAVEALRIVLALTQDVEHHDAFAAVLKTGSKTSIKHCWGDVHYRTYLRPIWQANRITGAIGLTIDVSDVIQEQEHRYREGIEAERKRVLTDFMNNATHDLRTPLSLIHTNLYLMERVTDPEKVKIRRDMLKGSISQLEEMLESMFIMTRLDLLPRFVENEVDVNAVIMASVGQISRDASEKQLRLEYELEVNLPSIRGHSSELQVAFCHALRNAVQHTPEGGVIRLASHHDSGQIVVEIADNGEGISDETLPHIFERFYRGDKARTMDGARNGMGLAIARKVIEKHDGSIRVWSQVGQGTTVIVTLPIDLVS